MRTERVQRVVNLCTTVILGLSILLLAACVVTAFAGRSSPNNAYLFGVKPMYVSTDAMEPEIRLHSLVLFRKAGMDEINVGDVVLRTYNERIVIRRVFRKTPEGALITKADNRFFEDSTALSGSTLIAVIF